MVFRRIRDGIFVTEKFLEDLILVLLSIFIIVLAISALAVLSSEAPSYVGERATTIAEITTLGFLAKAEYFATLMLPWMLILIGLLMAREVWVIRKRLEGIHFEVVLERMRRAREPIKTKFIKKRKR